MGIPIIEKQQENQLEIPSSQHDYIALFEDKYSITLCLLFSSLINDNVNHSLTRWRISLWNAPSGERFEYKHYNDRY